MTEPPETDRLAEGYEPRFDIDYSEVGRPGELFVMGIIEGLKSDRVEVKTDQVSQTTGNIYVEYACKKQGQYKPSGLAVTEASLWVFVLELGDLAIAVSVERLKELFADGWRNGKRRKCIRGGYPTKGVVIPIATLALSGTRAGRGRVT